jgi:kynurenine 3-monooxygenase
MLVLPSTLPVVAEALHSSSSTLLAASSFSSPDAVLAVYDWTNDHNGPLGVGAFAAAHCLSVVVCFPATVLFEIAAGFAFGFVKGTALAWAAKVVAALITFLAASRASPSPGDAAFFAEAFAARPELRRLADAVEREGARYTLLARLSPLPSWLNNYGLALAGVRFRDYAPATAVATLPAVLTHAYGGSLLSDLVSANAGNGGGTLAGSALGGLSVITGCLLLREMAVAVMEEEKEETSEETLE